jgi:NADH:ubiquinone oxidoreductase subunit E
MPTMQLEKILEGRRSQPHQLIEVLHDVQENYGFLSKTNMISVAHHLGVPEIEVYRVASFYKAFRLKATGKVILTICMGTACHVRGSRLLLDQALHQLGVKQGEVTPDGIFSVESVNCLGACARGPIVKENETFHHQMNPAKLRRLIDAVRRRETEGKTNA